MRLTRGFFSLGARTSGAVAAAPSVTLTGTIPEGEGTFSFYTIGGTVKSVTFTGANAAVAVIGTDVGDIDFATEGLTEPVTYTVDIGDTATTDVSFDFADNPFPATSSMTALTTVASRSGDIVTMGSLPDSLTTLDLEANALTAIPALPTSLTDLVLTDNSITSVSGADIPTNLTSLGMQNNPITSFSGTLPATLLNIVVSGAALTQGSVDAILAALVTAGASNGNAELDGGTSAAPSGAGATSAATLVSRGWTVTTN